MKKIHIAITGIYLSVVLTGCMSNTENVKASNTIKIIRESKHQSIEKRESGKIEVVDYNSSVISPERDGYKAPQYKLKRGIRKDKVGYGDKITNTVKSKVENKAEQTVNHTIDKTIDKGLSRIFR